MPARREIKSEILRASSVQKRERAAPSFRGGLPHPRGDPSRDAGVGCINERRTPRLSVLAQSLDLAPHLLRGRSDVANETTQKEWQVVVAHPGRCELGSRTV